MIKDNQVIAGGFEILINGNPLPKGLPAYVSEVKVEQKTSLPSSFSLRFDMGDFTELTKEKLDILNAGFKTGDEVVISMGFDSFEKLITGEIAVIEPQFHERISLEIRGYDRLRKLLSLPKGSSENGSFKDMKDSDIVTKIAQDAGLSAEVEDTKVVHPHVMRNNQNYFKFIEDMAKLNGYEFLANDKKIVFRKSRQDGSPDITLKYGIDFTVFSVQCREAPEGVEVRSWDSKNKKEVVSTAKNKAGGASGPSVCITDETVVDPEHADEIAKAKLDAMMKNLFSGDGRCCGNPKIVVGANIKIEGVGDFFSGAYYVTEAVHSVDDAGYMTSFKAQRKGK